MKLYQEAFLRLIYPAGCGVCQTLLEVEEQEICQGCRHKLSALRFSWNEAILHPHPPFLDDGWTLYPYESPAKEILMGIKFLRKRWLVRVFEEEMKPLVTAFASENHYDYLVPIPLDLQRLLVREFNQSELIAGLVSKCTGIPVNKTILKKRWKTPAQSQLSREERFVNLNQVFKVRAEEGIRSKALLLVDDIFTTGATAKEAARILKNYGAKRVDFFALARTESH
jgi:ComF family protein